MGLPVDRLIVATNQNDILARFLATGALRARARSSRPSARRMDIQVASNFERLLFDLDGRRRRPRSRRCMEGFRQTGGFALDAAALALPRTVRGGSADEADDGAPPSPRTLRATGELVDPHTAVGLAVAGRRCRPAGVPLVTLATAHPAKFPDAVEAAPASRRRCPPGSPT